MSMPSEFLYQSLLDSLKLADAEPKLEQFKAYLLEVNQRINLVSRQGSSKLVDELIADSLAMLEYAGYDHDARLLDIGSGAGFPWIVHKIARPDLQVVTVDSNQRKIEFQRAAARLLALADCEFHAARVESLQPLNVDYCIAKAFGSVELICRLAAIHLKPAGRLLLPRSASESFPVDAAASFGFVMEQESSYDAVGRPAKLVVMRRS
jgi:16S rRNA (guanine527-N7)-methyltransferase